MKNPRRQAATREAAFQRWELVPQGPRTTIRVFESDAKLLRGLFRWHGIGFNCAFTLCQLLAAAEAAGIWARTPEGPKPLPSFFRPCLGNPPTPEVGGYGMVPKRQSPGFPPSPA